METEIDFIADFLHSTLLEILPPRKRECVGHIRRNVHGVIDYPYTIFCVTISRDHSIVDVAYRLIASHVGRDYDEESRIYVPYIIPSIPGSGVVDTQSYIWHTDKHIKVELRISPDDFEVQINEYHEWSKPVNER